MSQENAMQLWLQIIETLTLLMRRNVLVYLVNNMTADALAP